MPSIKEHTRCSMRVRLVDARLLIDVFCGKPKQRWTVVNRQRRQVGVPGNVSWIQE